MTEKRRYLRRVGFWLPARCRSDVLARIQDDLDEHLEEVASRLGRTLTGEEELEALRRFGTPPVVATRYSPARPLVSGGLMTVYKRVLWIAVLGVLVGQLIAIIPGFVAADPGEHGIHLVAAGHRIAIGILLAFAAVTIVFAALTRVYWTLAPTP